jgi:hypothetical protein
MLIMIHGVGRQDVTYTGVKSVGEYNDALWRTPVHKSDDVSGRPGRRQRR